MLQAASDTGVLGDNTTSVRNPQFNVSGVPAGATLSLLRNGVVVSTVLSPGGGTVAIGDPGPLTDGQYTYTASLVDGAGNPSPPSGPLTISIVTVQGDYTGAGFTDLAVFDRVSPSVLDTFIAGGITPPGGSNAFGSGTLDIPFQGDLDGDGKTDLILYRPSTSQWFVQESSGGFQQYNFGAPGDIPVVGDFDGVGHDELAVYQPSTGQWFVAGHAGVFATFGGPSDIPVALRNYYGTGQDVLAVFRPSTGQWFVSGQSSGISFGGAGDVPIPLFNYYGTGRDVLAVFRPSTSQWFVAGQASGISFGGAGDVPISGDFDGMRPRRDRCLPAEHGPVVRRRACDRLRDLRRPGRHSAGSALLVPGGGSQYGGYSRGFALRVRLRRQCGGAIGGVGRYRRRRGRDDLPVQYQHERRGNSCGSGQDQAQQARDGQRRRRRGPGANRVREHSRHGTRCPSGCSGSSP